LALARKKRDEILSQLRDGLDPIAEKRKARKALEARKTFAKVAVLVIAARKSGRRDGSSSDDWNRSLMVAAKPLADKLVAEIDQNDIKRVLADLWDAGRHDAARRILNRIQLTLASATAHGWRSGDNPASWTIFQHIAPKPPKVDKPHHAALNWRECRRGQGLQEAPALGGRALRQASRLHYRCLVL
jgi:hypothetical protein